MIIHRLSKESGISKPDFLKISLIGYEEQRKPLNRLPKAGMRSVWQVHKSRREAGFIPSNKEIKLHP